MSRRKRGRVEKRDGGEGGRGTGRETEKGRGDACSDLGGQNAGLSSLDLHVRVGGG